MRVHPIFTLPFIFSSLYTLPSVLAEDSRTVQQIIQDANRLLQEGSYSEAARSYGEAIELDPTSYVNYYKRATAYLSLGRHAAALDDFDNILRLNPSFAQAHLQKAKILGKEGEFEKAQAELKAYGKSKSDEESKELASALTVALGAGRAAYKAAGAGSWHTCVEQATKALEAGPNAADLRELRVRCATELGDVDAVYGDLSRLAALNPSTLSLSLRLSHIAYFLIGSPSATNHIKQCLHYDPDSKPCKTIHKLLRSLEKDVSKARNFVEDNQWRQAIKVLDGPDGLLARFDAALDEASKSVDGVTYLARQFDPKRKSLKRLEIYGLACRAAVGAGDFKGKGVKWCEATLEMDPENVDALVGRGEKLMKEEKWEEAVRTLEKAFENGGRSSQDILNRVQKAQKLLKQSRQKDYYKVLGVPRDADERTIKKAFKTAAKKAHPDLAGGSEEKMAALNEAYEVLSNEELRNRYDNGDDPNDPHQGQQHNPFAHHGGMPQFFQQGGNPFSGGGFAGQRVQFQWG